MNQTLDIVGSAIIGLLIMLALMGFYSNMRETAASQVLKSNVQQELTSLTSTLEYDFRKIGYGITDSIKITRADSDNICFRGDFDHNGTPDSINYYVTPNPGGGSTHAKGLTFHRIVNGRSLLSSAFGVTRLRFWYYDASGNIASHLRSIRSIRIALSLESPSRVLSSGLPDSSYAGVCWERLMKPKNLR